MVKKKKNFNNKYFYKNKNNNNQQNFNNKNKSKKKKQKTITLDKNNLKLFLKNKRVQSNTKLISTTNYLHFNKILKQGIFLKKPSFNKIIYPFNLNLNLVNEFLKKK